MAGLIKFLDHFGSDSPTNGSIFFQDNYTLGHLLTIGQCYGRGFLYIGYGVRETSAETYISSTPVEIPRFIAIFTPTGIKYGVSDTRSVDIGEEVVLTFTTIRL